MPASKSGAAIVDLDRRDLPDHIPDLHDALVACAGATGEIDITVNIEIKNDAGEPDFDDARSIAALVVREALAVAGPHRWLISSFDLAMVDAVVATGAGIADGVARGRRAGRHRAVAHGARPPRTASVGRCRSTGRPIDECHAAGIAVNTWTCDDPERMRELIGWGVDGICTNVPDIALAVRAAL